MLGFTVVDLSTHQDIDCQSIYQAIQEEVDRIMNGSYAPCPPGYNHGFCCYDKDCNACREQWVKESWNLKGEKIRKQKLMVLKSKELRKK